MPQLSPLYWLLSLFYSVLIIIMITIIYSMIYYFMCGSIYMYMYYEEKMQWYW